MSGNRPLILFTNDDGIESPGLWALVEAFVDIADVLVVAPQEQQSGMGRSMPLASKGHVFPREVTIDGQTITAYGVDGTPAQAVQHGVLEFADRVPALVLSGINYGENTGNGVTISGTVGAALEAASLGIRTMAVSQQTAKDLHLTYSQKVDFAAGAHFARMFGEWLLNETHLPDDLDMLKLDLPCDATPETPWEITRLSRRRVYWPTRPERVALSDAGPLGYHLDANAEEAEPNSDVYTVLHEGIVSLTPMSLDMTSRLDEHLLRQAITSAASAYTKPIES